MITFIVCTLLAGFFGGLGVVVFCWSFADTVESFQRSRKIDKELVWTLLGSLFMVVVALLLVFGGFHIYKDKIECDILGGDVSKNTGLCVKEVEL